MIIVIGEILIDVFDNYQRIGGAPFNFAFHLKKMGWPVRFLTRIGEDTYGKNILDLLKKQQFNLDDVQTDRNHPTGTVQVTLDDCGVPQFDIRANVAYDYLDAAAAETIDWPSVQMIYMGSLAQRTSENFARIQTILSHKFPQTKMFFDINLRPPHVNTAAVEASMEHTDILKLNNDELSIVQNLFGGPEKEDLRISWIMERFFIEMVVLTKGPDGSTIYTTEKSVSAPGSKSTKIVDTVGAGDAYAAVTAAGFLKGLSMEAIVEKSSNFASYICTLQGAIPEETAIYKTLRQQIGGAPNA